MHAKMSLSAAELDNRVCTKPLNQACILCRNNLSKVEGKFWCGEALAAWAALRIKSWWAMGSGKYQM